MPIMINILWTPDRQQTRQRTDAAFRTEWPTCSSIHSKDSRASGTYFYVCILVRPSRFEIMSKKKKTKLAEEVSE